ncbi:MAG: hypothetical protein AAF986_07450, partial [Pseudomonadota bacterium]
TAIDTALKLGRANGADQFVRIMTEEGDGQLFLIHPVLGLGRKPHAVFALVTIRRPDQVWSFEATAAFFEAVGLLPSEARFVSAVLEQGSVAAASSHLGLSQQTGQTYLKRIFPKIGVKNQLELALFAAAALPSLRENA